MESFKLLGSGLSFNLAAWCSLHALEAWAATFEDLPRRNCCVDNCKTNFVWYVGQDFKSILIFQTKSTSPVHDGQGGFWQGRQSTNL